MPTEIEPHVIEASRVLTNLRLNLFFACFVLAEELTKFTAKEAPCTFQTYRAGEERYLTGWRCCTHYARLHGDYLPKKDRDDVDGMLVPASAAHHLY